jgi:DNA-binding transcriptional MerR regulator
MPDSSDRVDIPKRALFKSSEVCEIVKVQPYVLRSWETEFPGLGVAKTAGGPRMYRRGDVEQVVRIKHLLLVDGLTLAGARRKLEEESMPVAPDAPLDELIGENARDRLTAVKRGLRAILDILSARPVAGDVETVPHPRSAARSKSAPTRGRVDASRAKQPRSRAAAGRKRPP